MSGSQVQLESSGLQPQLHTSLFLFSSASTPSLVTAEIRKVERDHFLDQGSIEEERGVYKSSERGNEKKKCGLYLEINAEGERRVE